MKTRRLAAPWPFLFTVTSRGLVQNLPPKVSKPKRSREAALTAEVIAIARENPAHNVQHAKRVLSEPPRAAPAIFTYAIEHVASGWRDGNYFTEEDGDGVFVHFVFTYPQEKFRLIVARAGDPAFPFGASNGARALRDFESHLWRMSA